MNNYRLKYLLTQYSSGLATSEEIEELLDWIKNGEPNSSFKAHIQALWEEYTPEEGMDFPDWNEVYGRIAPIPVRTINKPTPFRWIAAAVIVFAVVTALIVMLAPRNERTELAGIGSQDGRFKNDVDPGGDKAILTLADGHRLMLDDMQGRVAEEGGAFVTNQVGKLSYNENRKQESTGVYYHTVSTPRGGQYQIVLADGTRVWLNAASSLRFPTAFTGNDRVVELTGEGYFEVTHNPSKPFHVRVKDMDVRVLGTHFNINSYENEGLIKTTLVEGSIKVTKGPSFLLLTPGRQAQVGDDSLIKIVTPKLEEVIAWKEGYFQFTDANIESIMKQVERWYNVDVEYDGKVLQRFNGSIPRDVPLSNFFRILESTGWVHFRIEGRKITVMP